MLQDWKGAGLLFPSAVKRGLFTLDQACIIRRLGHFSASDLAKLDQVLREWLGL